LARLLNFRDKEQDRKARLEAKQAGTLTQDEQEMDEWEKEMKGYLFERKVKATDRTKTPEEIAKEEADRLHELETRRLARMNGDFENDDFSDISDDDGDAHKRQKRRKKTQKPTNKEARNPDELDSDDEGDDGNVLQTKFTEDGLVYINKQGEIVGKVGEGDDPIQGNGNKRVDGDSTENSEVEDSDDIGDSEEDASVESGDGLSEGEESDLEEITYEVGTKVKGKYLADQQMEGKAKWYKGSITKVTQDTKGNTLYEILYDDGDIEENVRPENVRRQKVDVEEAKAEESKRAQIANLSLKRQKAKQKAR
jgi:nucleolar protein 14